MIARKLASLILLTFALVIGASEARCEKRAALVIGNSKYQHVTQLINPRNDAAAMTAVFKKAGFDTVISQENLGIADMRRAIRDFAIKTADADIALVYYAGHGIEVDGVNYLIPADAKLATDFDVEDETVSLDRVLQSLNSAKRLRLVILDACRENPFAKTMKRGVATRSVGRGLAKVEPTQSDTLVAFAAKAGAVAADGDAANSPFAAALVKYIATPGLDLRIAFGRVRDDVLKTTGNRQEPFVYGSLGGETVSLVPPLPAPVDPNADARREYEFAAQIGTKDAWTSFLRSFNAGLYADLARAALAKLETAERASIKAEQLRQQAETQSKLKAEEFRRQLEEQAAKQAADAKRQMSEQAKRDLEIARQQIAEQAKRDLDEARRQAAEAQKQAEDARKQIADAKAQAAANAQKEVEEAKRVAAEKAAREAEAERKSRLAALTTPPEVAAPAPTPAVAVAPAMDPADIARLLQAHLKRVGCDPGANDGAWTSGSQKALNNFNTNAGTSFDVRVASLDALDGVRGKSARVCPLVCGTGQRAEGDRCIAITCDAGSVLDSSGSCVKRAPVAAKPTTAARRDTAVRPSAPAAPARGGKCFSFNGRTYCE